MEESISCTLADVASAPSASRRRVYELVASGALPAVRIGGSRRVRGEDLAGYVDSLERVAATPPASGW